MNFLKWIKEEMNDIQKRQGVRNKVIVDPAALRELINDYERLDSAYRTETGHQVLSPHYHLHNAITAVFHQNKRDSEATILDIMETLLPLIKEKRKSQEVDYIFRR